MEWLCINSYINPKGNDMFTTVKMFLLSNAYKLLGFSIKKIIPIIYAYSNVYKHNTCLNHMCTYYTYSIFIHIYYTHSTFIHTYYLYPEDRCAHILYHLQHAYTLYLQYTHTNYKLHLQYMFTYTLYTPTVHVCAHTTMRKAHVNKQFCSH